MQQQKKTSNKHIKKGCSKIAAKDKSRVSTPKLFFSLIFHYTDWMDAVLKIFSRLVSVYKKLLLKIFIFRLTRLYVFVAQPFPFRLNTLLQRVIAENEFKSTPQAFGGVKSRESKLLIEVFLLQWNDKNEKLLQCKKGNSESNF